MNLHASSAPPTPWVKKIAGPYPVTEKLQSMILIDIYAT